LPTWEESQPSPLEWVSAVAGVISAVAGPRAGGVFLAFPAILLASLTLVAKEEGPARARDDARGAIFGTLGR
jgi:hypothetical protein